MSPGTPVHRIMTEQVHTVRSDATVQVAVDLMIKHDISCLPVSLGQGPVGMVTERDILSKVIARERNPKKVQVREIMSVPLVLGTTDMSVDDAAKKMNENNIRRLVIVDGAGNLAGLITITDIIRWMSSQSEELGLLKGF